MAKLHVLEGLERKIEVTVPAEKIDSEVDKRLKDIAPKAKIKGFRAGKVPEKVVRQQYGAGVRQEAVAEITQNSLVEALQEVDIDPVARPHIHIDKIPAQGEALEFSATFEVSPEVKFDKFSKLKIEKPIAEVGDQDIDKVVGQLQQQQADWEKVDRAAQDGDRLTIDFKGSIDGTPFEGGAAEKFQLTLGSKSMIPGFEEGMMGFKENDEKPITVTFPENYHAENLAGKEAVFDIKVHSVEAPKLHELNDDFAKLLGVTEGYDHLRADIAKRLTVDMKLRVQQLLQKNIADAIAEAYKSLELPKTMIAEEIARLKEQTKNYFKEQMKGQSFDLPDIPDDIAKTQAERRVLLDLVFSSFVREEKIELDAEKVKEAVKERAASYENPEEVEKWFMSQHKLMHDIQGKVFEQQVFDKILEKAKVTEKNYSYTEVMEQQV